jgi:hypothetical protein
MESDVAHYVYTTRVCVCVCVCVNTITYFKIHSIETLVKQCSEAHNWIMQNIG